MSLSGLRKRTSFAGDNSSYSSTSRGRQPRCAANVNLLGGKLQDWIIAFLTDDLDDCGHFPNSVKGWRFGLSDRGLQIGLEIHRLACGRFGISVDRATRHDRDRLIVDLREWLVQQTGTSHEETVLLPVAEVLRLLEERQPNDRDYLQHWTAEDIRKWEAAIPDMRYRASGASLEIRHHVELLKREWERRVGTSFPGVSRDALWGVASWAGIDRHRVAELTAGEIYAIAMSVIETSQEERLVTLAEFAEMVGIARKTLYNRATKTPFPPPVKPKAGRRAAQYYMADLWAWLEKADSALYQSLAAKGFPVRSSV